MTHPALLFGINDPCCWIRKSDESNPGLLAREVEPIDSLTYVNTGFPSYYMHLGPIDLSRCKLVPEHLLFNVLRSIVVETCICERKGSSIVRANAEYSLSARHLIQLGREKN